MHGSNNSFHSRLKALERLLGDSLTPETEPPDYSTHPATLRFHAALAEYHDGDAFRSTGTGLSDADRRAMHQFDRAAPERCKALLEAMAAEAFTDLRGGDDYDR